MPIQYAAETPPLVRPGLITALRRAGLARSYQDQASIQRMTAIATRSGGRAITWAAVNAVPCRLSRGFIPAREQTIAGSVTEIATAIVYTAPQVDIRASDRLVISSLVDPSLPEITLEVQRAEVRRTTDLEQVVTCSVVGSTTTTT